MSSKRPRRGWSIHTKRTSRPTGRQKIFRAKADADAALARDRAWGRAEAVAIVPAILQPQLGPVHAGPTATSMARPRRRAVGDGVAADSGHEVVPLVEQRSGDLAAGVVGVGDEHHGGVEPPGHGSEESDQLVEQATSIAVGKHETFVDAARERDGEQLAEGP